jgi:hypothetical protein
MPASIARPVLGQWNIRGFIFITLVARRDFCKKIHWVTPRLSAPQQG